MARYEEERIQEAIVKRFWELKHYKQLNYDMVLYSNRNENNVGGSKGIASGARFKRMGRLAGVPDLTIIDCEGQIYYVEVKTPKALKTSKGVERKGKGMNKDQLEFYEHYIKPYNIDFAVVSSVQEFEDFIRFIPFK